MRTRGVQVVVIAALLTLLALPSFGFGQERAEGKVISTTLTACEFKPGTCEGSLVLETTLGGSPGPVSVKVPKGTLIKKGDDYLFLPSLKGREVAITYIEQKGEKVAKSIVVKP